MPLRDATLVGLAYSPWTLQARWALHHHRLPYRFEPYLPMLGEPALRARLSRLEGRVVLETLSVPILFEGGRAVHDSRAIAEHVDVEGVHAGTPTLFPPELVESLDRWLHRLEQAKRAARILATQRMLKDDAAILGGMPERWPWLVRRASLPIGRRATQYILDKYGGRSFEGADGRPSELDEAGLLALVRDVLVAAEDTLGRHRYVLGDALTFADFALATTLQFVKPSPALVKLDPAFAASWTDARLERELGRLLDYRDRLVEQHPFRRAR